MIDPSHGTGRYEYVPAMALAAIAAGADSLMIEVIPILPKPYPMARNP
jgi:3-deoxy-7-phosphoheptulonate synthase